MTAPTFTLEVQRVPMCPTCTEPMSVIRIVTPTPTSELRVFSCKGCGVAMFTEIV